MSFIDEDANNLNVINNSRELEEVFRTHQEKLISLLMISGHNRDSKMAVHVIKRLSEKHTISIFCIINIDNFKGDSRFVEKNGTVPRLECYYAGNKLAIIYGTQEHEYENAINNAQRMIMGQSTKTRNENPQQQGLSRIQLQQQFLNQLQNTNPQKYMYLINNQDALQQELDNYIMMTQQSQQYMAPQTQYVPPQSQQYIAPQTQQYVAPQPQYVPQQDNQQNQFAQLMPQNGQQNQFAQLMNQPIPQNGQQNQFAQLLNQSMPQNSQQNQFAQLMNQSMPASLGTNSGWPEMALPQNNDFMSNMQQMQKMFEIFQLMQKMGLISGAEPTESTIDLPDGNQVIPLGNGKYGLVKKN